MKSYVCNIKHSNHVSLKVGYEKTVASSLWRMADLVSLTVVTLDSNGNTKSQQKKNKNQKDRSAHTLFKPLLQNYPLL